MIFPPLAAALAAALAVLPAAAPEPGSLCSVADERLEELSGLAVDAAGLWGIADGGRRVEIHRLEAGSAPGPASDPSGDCAVVATRTARTDPRDTEDLAVGPDGALWVADIGDNDRGRETVAVIVVPARGEPRLHRLAYPDGPHDAEALLVDAPGAPVIVTKDAAGPAGIYRTEGPLAGPGIDTAGPPAGEGPTALVRVGELALPPSDTEGGPLGGLGSRVVTGAAATADRRVVAVRTYTDAWLYAAPDGDVVAALARPAARPVRVPLPDEPQGEAIAFQADGTLLSGSESRDGEPGELRAVPGAAALVVGSVGAAAEPTGDPSRTSTPGDPAPAWLPAALGVVAVAGILALITAAMAQRRR